MTVKLESNHFPQYASMSLLWLPEPTIHLVYCVNQDVGYKWALTRKDLPWFANNKGTDQPSHRRSLISAFVIHLLESIISAPLLFAYWKVYQNLLPAKFHYSS